MPTQQTMADRLSAPLERVRMRYERSPLSTFLRWWGGELASMLPRSWRALFAEGQARVFYVIGADALELRLEQAEAGCNTLLASIPLASEGDPGSIPGQVLSAQVDTTLGANRGDRPRWLLLPGGQVLRRRIALPAAATERLREVIAHELDRQTPFRADQVAYDCRVLGVDPVSKMAQVELLVLPKDKLDAALAPLGPLANRLSGVDARDEEGRPLNCNLLPPERRQPRNRRMLWLHVGLAAIALIALVFALSQMLDNRRAAVAGLEAQVAARHEQARQVGTLSRQLDQASDSSNFLVRARAEKPPMLAVLADISARIPDTTWLERFSQQDRQLYLTGLSSDAASLVVKLQASPLLRTPALSGSVQPDAASKRDRFTLVAELAGTPLKGAVDAPAQP
jgi:general secretion pathway protein L